MSLTEDPWRLSAGRDHILCGAFKKRPLGGTGHIRGLAHFPEGQKIIRCTQPNSTNPIHNYTYGSNKLCHFPRKLNYYIETSINNNKIKTLRGTVAKMISPSPPRAETCGSGPYSFSAFCCVQGLILLPTGSLYSGEDLRLGFSCT